MNAEPESDRRAACSVVVLTLNEERNLAACLASLRGFDDLHVLDSGSTDGTAAIAQAAGAKLSHHAFDSFGAQRNWAHEQLPLRHDWVLHLDADERMTPALRDEIVAAIAGDAGQLAGYFVAERTLLQGRWLRHAGQYPRYQARLVHRRRMRFIDHGHGQREQSSLPFGRLRQAYDHLAFSHGIEHWLRKHAGYAMREAEQAAAAPRQDLLAGLLAREPTARRRALKALALRLPARPLLRWVYVMVLRRGLLDGRAGWQYAAMMVTFQRMIDLCTDELRAAAGAARPALPPAATAAPGSGVAP